MRLCDPRTRTAASAMPARTPSPLQRLSPPPACQTPRHPARQTRIARPRRRATPPSRRAPAASAAARRSPMRRAIAATTDSTNGGFACAGRTRREREGGGGGRREEKKERDGKSEGEVKRERRDRETAREREGERGREREGERREERDREVEAAPSPMLTLRHPSPHHHVPLPRTSIPTLTPAPGGPGSTGRPP